MLSIDHATRIQRNQNQCIGSTFRNSGTYLFGCSALARNCFVCMIERGVKFKCAIKSPAICSICCLFQMVLPNLTTNTLYEIKVGAASLSTINPHQVIFGSYSEPQKVFRRNWRETDIPHTYLLIPICMWFFFFLDFIATRLREASTIATKKSNGLQFDDARWRSLQLLWNHFNSIGIRFVAVSSYYYSHLIDSLCIKWPMKKRDGNFKFDTHLASVFFCKVLSIERMSHTYEKKNPRINSDVVITMRLFLICSNKFHIEFEMAVNHTK